MNTSSTSTPVDKLQGKVDRFLEEFVANPNYHPRWPSEPKIVHDTLWGTIRLEPWEIALLDLPLFQRLRQIRQTSLTNYVFPGCTHSRFEHTLGVLLQTQKLVDAINLNHESSPFFDHNTVHNLRLAALFHDAGHSCFSHLSENVYKHYPDIKEVIEEEEGEFEGCHPHEIFGALMLRSEVTKQYLTGLSDHYVGITFDPDRASKWIVGQAANDNPDFLFQTQVINGPSDADKLDYIFRDAHYSGLPLGLDLDRLWSSCKVQREPQSGAKIITLHQSSATPLEQILFNKINLFTVVYQHPKVRAAECMFQGVIELIANDNGKGIGGRRLDTASDFLWITDDVFFGEASHRKKDKPVHKLIHEIFYRRHLVRALTISRDAVKSSPDTYAGLRRLNQNTIKAVKERRDIARDIWEHAGEPHTKHHVWIDLPSDPPIGEADTTYVRTASGRLRKLSKLFPVHYWAEMYTHHKWRGHVFCPPDYQQKVHEASLEVLKERFGLTFSESAGQSSHVPNPKSTG